MFLQLGPIAAQDLDLRPAGTARIENAGLVGQPLGRQNAGGGQDVGVMVALIALAVRRMHCYICRHPVALDELLGERSRSIDLRDVKQFGRQGQLPFAGGRRVRPGLPLRGGIAERGVVLRPIGCIRWEEDEPGLDSALGGLVVHARFAVAGDDGGGPIGLRHRG